MAYTLRQSTSDTAHPRRDARSDTGSSYLKITWRNEAVSRVGSKRFTRAFPTLLIACCLYAAMRCSVHAQGSPPHSAGYDDVADVRDLQFSESAGRAPLRFSLRPTARTSFEWYFRSYEGEGSRDGVNDVAYLGWNVLGRDSAAAGFWLNFENDYHGWFEHNLDVRAENGAFVRRMKTAIDRPSGDGVSKSWAFDHITFHHGRVDAGAALPQIAMTLDASPDFTELYVNGSVRLTRRMHEASARMAARAGTVLPWAQTSLLLVDVDEDAALSFVAIGPGQRLTLVLLNPRARTVTLPAQLRWPRDGEASARWSRAGTLLLELLALDEQTVLVTRQVEYP